MYNSGYSTATHFHQVFRCISFSFCLLVVLTGFTASAVGQVVIPLQETSSDLPKIFTNTLVDDHILIGTENGLWILQTDGDVHKVEGPKGWSFKVATIGERLYVGAENGLWIVGNNGLATNIMSLDISHLTAVGDYLLIQTSAGGFPSELWILSRNGKPMRVAGMKEHLIHGAAYVGNQLFVQSGEGLWIVDSDGKAHEFDKIKSRIGAIQSVRGLLLGGADDGFWIIDENGSVTKLESITGEISHMGTLSDRFYAITDKGLWIISKDGGPLKIEAVGTDFVGYTSNVDEVLVVKPDGAWIVNKAGEASRVKGLNQVPVRDLLLLGINGQFFIVTAEARWIIGEDGQAIKVEGTKGIIGSKLWAGGDQIFYSTDLGLWIVTKDGKAAELEHLKGSVHDIRSFGQVVYIETAESVYLLNQKAKIITELAPAGWWSTAVGYVLPSTWLPVGKVEAIATYSDEIGRTPNGKTLPKEFRFAKADGDLVPSDEKFSTQEQFKYDLGWGKNNVHYWVKDKWGNTLEQKHVYFGVPSQYSVAILPFIFSAMFVLGCFALAPHVGFCHAAIMNPWLRKYFSLGSIPLLLSLFPSLRRYVLSRYAAAIRVDNEFAEWEERFVCPDIEFQPENFGNRLESEKRLLLTGRSGVGKTSFFKHLTAHYASQEQSLAPANIVPVFIPLTNYGGNSLEDLVYNQLFSRGGITDKELAPMFLEQGGLLIFLDGINEVSSVADRQRLSEFIKKFGSTNYMCLSSQQSYPEIDSIPKLELKTFTKEKVCIFLRKRVNDNKTAEAVISKLTDEDYVLYGVPRDLEFAVEILNGGNQSLPKSRTELYKTIFRSLFLQWKENGNPDAEDMLCQRAYVMITQRDSVFDSVDKPRYREITTDLLEQKFLMQRENNYNFRHDLIRSFLASEYFYLRWDSLLAAIPEKQIDINWLEMLKFSCEHIDDSAELKRLVYEVLDGSLRKDVVKRLFEWLKANYPDRSNSWEQEFYAKYGEMDFRV